MSLPRDPKPEIRELAERLYAGDAIPASSINVAPGLDQPGVYIWFFGKKPIYVGRSGKDRGGGKQVTVRIRLKRHFGGGQLEKNWKGKGVKRWVRHRKRVQPPQILDWMRKNLAVKAVHVPDAHGRHKWRHRALLEHYLVALLAPEANLDGEREH